MTPVLLVTNWMLAVCPVPVASPEPDWITRATEVSALRPTEVKALEDFAFTLTGEEAERKGMRTDALLVIQGGSIRFERYARGYDVTKRHIAYSVTKALMVTLAGAAQHLDLLHVTDSVCKYYHPQDTDLNCDITIEHLVALSSGLRWNETPEGSLALRRSSLLAMLHGEGHQDMARFVAGHEQIRDPGKAFIYSTGDSTLLAAVLREAVRESHGDDFAWPLLFEPLGMDSAVLETDKEGTPVGGAFGFATPRDFARLGHLYLHDGCWEGTRLLPEGWMAQATTVSAPYRQENWSDTRPPLGWAFWLNQAFADRPKVMPDVPDDAFFAQGFRGQFIFVIPSWDMVVVRTGDDRDTELDRNELLKRARAVAP